jgi:alpha-galactosidase
VAVAAVLELDGLRLPARLEGDVEATSGGLLLPGSSAALLHPWGETRFYRHGWQSWSPALWERLSLPPRPVMPPERRAQADDPVHALSSAHAGSGLGGLEGPDGRVLLLGALGTGARVEGDGELLRGYGSSGGWFLGSGDEAKVFSSYARLLGERLGRGGGGEAPRVWCSWYSFYTNISEPAMLEVLAGLSGLPFDVFQLDDGWQRDMGDWEANETFPGGMERFAERVRQSGLRPGLWLSPLIVRPSSSLFAERPDWLLRDSAGALVPAGFNWGGPYYALDTTRSEVGDWLEDLMRRVVGWGYDYLKLDFLYAGALQGKRFRDLPREEAYREALSRLRGAARDAYLLACGAPVLPSLGLCDGLRVGPDVAPYWDNEDRSLHLNDPTGPGTRSAVSNTVHRLWLSPLVHVDPDVAYFRTRYNLLTPSERRLLQDLGLVAGFKATSDPPDWLDPEERESLRAFLEPVPRCGGSTVGASPSTGGR